MWTTRLGCGGGRDRCRPPLPQPPRDHHRRRRPERLAGGRARPAPAVRRATTASCAARAGAQTLEALRELKLRGEQVAVILADYRMPQMNGIEFLEQAMDIFPAARRVLLTAYADTDAAIQAINLVDVDHYLLKPWDPPEEQLYPVVDELLDLWRRLGPRAGDRDQGDRPPLVARGRSRSATSWPATACPTAGTPPRSAEAARLLTAAEVGTRLHPGRDHPRGRGAALPQRRRARRAGRPVGRPRRGLLRRGRGRRRARRARRRRLRRVRGAAHRAGRAQRHRRAGRPELAGSRTTSASPTASPGRSWPSAPAGRP